MSTSDTVYEVFTEFVGFNAFHHDFKFKTDLELTAIDKYHVLRRLEEVFDISIPDYCIRGDRMIGDIIKDIQEILDAKS
jgi:hypothetical protein